METRQQALDGAARTARWRRIAQEFLPRYEGAGQVADELAGNILAHAYGLDGDTDDCDVRADLADAEHLCAILRKLAADMENAR